MKKSKLPRTDSIKELAAFWESHDFTDFEDQMERVDEPTEKRQAVVQVRLQPKEAKIVKGIAKSRGVKDSDVIRDWIREKIRS